MKENQKALQSLALEQEVRATMEHAWSPRTSHFYETDWARFVQFCLPLGKRSLPASADTVRAFLVSESKQFELATILRRLAAINARHSKVGNFKSFSSTSEMRSLIRSLRRKSLRLNKQERSSVTLDILTQLLSHLPSGLVGLRDRALLLFLFASGLKRHEVCSINADSLEFTKEGFLFLTAASHTTEPVGLLYGKKSETCPVRAVKSWIEAAGIKSGPLFRSINKWGQIRDTPLSTEGLAAIVKHYFALSGLNLSAFSTHSFRAGMIIEALNNGATPTELARHSGFKRASSLQKYFNASDAFANNPSSKLGL